MPGGRPPGSKNRYKSKRTQTAAQMKRQTDSCAASKQETKKQKEKQKEQQNAEVKRANQEKRNNFFLPRTKPSSEEPTAAPTNNDTTTTAAAGSVVESADDRVNAAADENSTTATVAENNSAAPDFDVVTINNPTINNVIDPANAIAELDYSEEEATQKQSDDFEDDTIPGIQQQYVAAVQKRVQIEVSKDNKNINDKWLLPRLQQNDWWLPKESYRWFIKKYNASVEKKEDKLSEEYKAYYRDVHVWLPDVRWERSDKRYMPYCPNCKTNARVGPHCFRDNHAGRVIIGQTETYYAVSRRYICYECEDHAKKQKTTFEAAAKEQDLTATVELDDTKYTFMGWNQSSLTLLPYNKGNKFPAFLTWRAGVDKSLITTLRQDIDSGKGFEQISKDLLEHHTEKYTDVHLEYENEIKEKLDGGIIKKEYPTFSEFMDKKRYRGLVPTGAYLQHVLLLYHDSIRIHLIKEVKKRGATTLHWDVSYKEAKHLYRVRGQPIFKGLVTAMNEFGEIRIQFHVYTDSHEQMQAALEAFMRTTEALGQPPMKYFWTDNPTGDRRYFLECIPSLKASQDALDAMCNDESQDGPTTTSNASNLPVYDYSSIDVHEVTTTMKEECNQKIRAMLQDMKENIKTIGLDAEWNVERNSTFGMQSGSSKVKLIQMAYRDNDNKIQVLIVRTGKWASLPSEMIDLLCDDSMKFVGVNVSADLKKIGKDFNVDGLKAVDQKERANVINLGTYARERDVVQNARHGSMELLAERVMGIFVDKTQQESDWSGDLNPAQIQYAALDAAISLELFEKLGAMTDLTRRLSEKELTAGMKVDVAPHLGQFSQVAMLNTRAATATVVGRKVCHCPTGIVSKKGNAKKVRPCPNSYVVKVDVIHATNFTIPGYKKKDTNEKATLGDIGLNEIVVPMAMLRAHTASDVIRPSSTGSEPQDTDSRQSPPASKSTPKRVPNRSLRKPLSDEFDYGDTQKEPATDTQAGDDENDDDELENYDDFIFNEFDAHINGLTSQEISWLEAAIFQAEEAGSGKDILQCEKLDDAPAPQDIKNKFSVVLGDIYHAMNRAKVPVKHEGKKAYFNALRNAFLIWNPKKVEEFDGKMRDDGMDEDEIKAMKYFKPHLYDECIERHAPAPRILYYRVRAVFKLFGNLIDSKTKKPLFNTEAWKKANQVLKEILEGFYSDPLGVNLYSKKMKSDGTVMRNKYGMELIECFRGTNRVEAYHKHLHPSVKSKMFGVQLADCLLAEKRHRHNQRIAERRRAGHPTVGHFSLHKIDQLQDLYLENHGTLLYPGWDSASAYKQTDESFDTIALHHEELHDALKARREQLGNVTLTKDMQYMCNAMGVPLPLLPFSKKKEGKEERQLFVKMMLQHEGPIDEVKFALEWCKHVDPEKNIHAKLPCHIRVEAANFDRNQQRRETMRKAKSGIDALNELHDKISPTILEESNANETPTNDSPAAPAISPPTNTAPSRKRKASAVGLSHTLQEPMMPRPFPIPPAQALHTAPFVQHGGMIIGRIPLPIHMPTPIARKKDTCTLCTRNGGRYAYICPGRGSHNHCVHYNSDNTPKPATTIQLQKPSQRKPRTCKLCSDPGCKGRGGVQYCRNK